MFVSTCLVLKSSHFRIKIQRSGSKRTHIVVIITLDPSNETQNRQYLRLDLQRDIEVASDIVRAERDACTCPEKHHGPLKTNGIVSAVVDDYLRNKLGVLDGF